MGSGKSLLLTALIDKYDKKYPERHKFCTFPIKNIHNFELIRYGFLPISKIRKLQGAFIGIDDASHYDGLEAGFKYIANESRKKDLDLAFTTQYYTQLTRNQRFLLDYDVEVNYEPDTETLKACFTNLDNEKFFLIINNCSYYYDMYDTKYICETLLESEKYQYVINHSENLQEAEMNLSLMFKTTKFNKQITKLQKEKKFY